MKKNAIHQISGLWAIDSIWLSSHWGQMEALSRPLPDDLSAYVESGFDPVAASRRDELYSVEADGIARIPIVGPMVKAHSFWTRIFGFASTQEVSLALRQAAADPDIRGIMLAFDSPGGQVAGTNDLAETVRQVDKIKPVFAHGDDMMASAAYWVASQARSITLNAMGEAGSIGVMAFVPDTTELYAQAGIKVHLISTGEYKGAGAPGVPVTDEHLTYFQERVDSTFSTFANAVRRGRQMSVAEFAAVSDGRVFGSKDAHNLKLIDRVRSLDEAIKDASRLSSEQSRSVRGRIAELIQANQL